jgi:hypothetical protein
MLSLAQRTMETTDNQLYILGILPKYRTVDTRKTEVHQVHQLHTAENPIQIQKSTREILIHTFLLQTLLLQIFTHLTAMIGYFL